MNALRRHLRENPQVALLVVIALIFGIGAFIVVLIALLSSGSTTPTGEPSGALEPLRVTAGVLLI